MKSFVSYSEQADPVFDREGNEIGEKKYILIDLVYVTPEDRGHGLARKMLKEALDILKSQELPVRLYALPKEKTVDLARLVSFYESMGFSVMESSGGAGVAMEL